MVILFWTVALLAALTKDLNQKVETNSMASIMGTMTSIIELYDRGSYGLMAYSAMSRYLKSSPIEEDLRVLIDLRVSQLNGKIMPSDILHRDIFQDLELESILFALDDWQAADCFTRREKVALAWTEALLNGEVDRELHYSANQEFSPGEIIDLTLLVSHLKTWKFLDKFFN